MSLKKLFGEGNTGFFLLLIHVCYWKENNLALNNEKVSMYHIFESHTETNDKNICIVYFRLFQISNNLIIFRIFRI